MAREISRPTKRIILEKSYKLPSKEELLREENKYIESSLNDVKCLNVIRAVQDYEVTREMHKIYSKVYRDRHIEQVKARERVYKESHAVECRKRHDSYYMSHRNELQEYDRKRYAIKVLCKCGKEIPKPIIKRHEKSKEHINFIMSQNVSP